MVSGVLIGGKYGAVLPTSVPGCVWWLDAADTNTIVLNGADVTQWNDKSGGNYSVAQTTPSKQPLYDIGSLNSLNSIKFTAAGQEGLITTAGATFANKGHSVFIIVKPIAVTDSDVLGTGGITAGNILVMFFGSYGRGHDFRNGSNAVIDSTAAADADAIHLLGQILNDAETAFSVNLDGSLTSVAVAGAAVTPNTTLTMPGRDTVTYSNVSIGEVLIYNREVSESERTRIQTYLKDKWAYV